MAKITSARSAIVKALVEKLREIDGTGDYQSELMENNVSDKLVFWDELNDWPYVCAYAGDEDREYLPGGFKWGFLIVSIKAYVNEEDPVASLEKLLSDIEIVIDNNQELVIDIDTNRRTEEINILSIRTDEGLLAPFGVGDVTLRIRYQVL